MVTAFVKRNSVEKNAVPVQLDTGIIHNVLHASAIPEELRRKCVTWREEFAVVRNTLGSVPVREVFLVSVAMNARLDLLLSIFATRKAAVAVAAPACLIPAQNSMDWSEFL